MTTTIDRDIASLVRACWDNTEERASQLALVDLLQERGEEERSELVRVGVELEQWKGDGTRCPVCEWPIEGRGCSFDNCSYRPREHTSSYNEWMPRQHKFRNVLARVTSLQAALSRWPCRECGEYGKRTWAVEGGSVEDTCPACGGSGDVLRRWSGTVNDGRETTVHSDPLPLTWCAGYPQFATLPRLADCVTSVAVDCKTCSAHRRRGRQSDLLDCLVCGNTGSVRTLQPTPRLAALCGTPPWGLSLDGVIPADRRPYLWQGRAYWSRQTWGDDASVLPDPVFLLLEDGTSSNTDSMRGYDTFPLAVHALARSLKLFAAARPPAL